MQMQVFSIFDQKAKVFNLPFFKHTAAEAERDFTAVVRDPKSVPGQFPEDFDLYHVGEYDDQTGIIKSLDTPQHIIKAIQVTTN